MAQKLETINVENLKLDLYNPRLPKSKQGKDENVVIDYLLLEAATTELMESIGENNFFAGEMLLVVRAGEDGKYTVVEGNRRLAAVKLLSDPGLARVKKLATKDISDKAKFKPIELPCLVFDSREEILQYIGFVHITGKKSWRVLEKARYLNDIRKNETYKDLSLSVASKEIAKIIGSRSPYVKKMLVSYSLYEVVEDESFYQIDGLSDSTFFLNYFSDGLQKDNIRAYLNVNIDSETPLVILNKEHLHELVMWWFQKNEGVTRVIGDSEGMKMLNAVLGDEIALAEFKRGMPILDAYELTNDIDIQFESKISAAIKAMEQADRLSNKVKHFYSALEEDLKAVRKIAMKISEFKSKSELYGDEF